MQKDPSRQTIATITHTSSELLLKTNNTSKWSAKKPRTYNCLFFRHAYIATLKKLEWSKVAALTQDGARYSDYMSSLQDELQNNGIEFVMNRKFPREATDMSMVRIPVYVPNF